MLTYKQSITNLPTYDDGYFRIYEICQNDDTFHKEYLKDTKRTMWFEEISISDSLRFETENRKKKLTLKIRIPQMKQLSSLHVLKIGKEYHKVFNAYHFTNKDGFKQTDLTLEEYPRAILEEDL